MANTSGAIKRIRYLAGKGPYARTPSAITGDRDEIRSYRLVIASRDRDTGEWDIRTDLVGEVVKPGNARHGISTRSSYLGGGRTRTGGKSPTTDRHIRAAVEALTQEEAHHDA